MTKIFLYLGSTLNVWAMREALANRKGLEIVGATASEAELEKQLKQSKADILVSTMYLASRDAFALLTNRIDTSGAEAERTKIVLISDYEETHLCARALRLGVSGIANEAVDGEDLVATLTKVSRGEQVATQEMLRLAKTNADSPSATLSQREVQVMEKLAMGYTNREIADSLAISVKTVDTHRGHVLKKLQLRNNSDLTRFAIKHGLIPS